MKAYSEDLRIRVLQAYLNQQGSMRQIAERFDVSLSFVLALVKQYRQSGDIAPRSRGGGQKLRVDDQGLAILARLVESYPHATLQELCTHFGRETDIQLSIATMSRCYRRLQKRHNEDQSNNPKIKPRRRGRPPRRPGSDTMEA